MVKFLGRLFGSEKAQESLVNGAVSAIDKLFHTSEEKSDARMKTLGMWLEWVKSTSGSRVARRLIGLIVVVTFALAVIAGLTAIMFGLEACMQQVATLNGQEQVVTTCVNKAALIKEFVVDIEMTTITLWTVGFYMLAPQVQGMVQSAVNRVSKKGSRNDNSQPQP